MDDGEIDPFKGGIDHFEFVPGACPGPAADGDVIVPSQQPRYSDPKYDKGDPQTYNHSVDVDIARFAAAFAEMETWTKTFDTNFYLSHRPVFAIGCDFDQYITADWTIQQALSKHTLDRVSAMVGGHMHWFQGLAFEDEALPAQLVVGNGGTKLIPNLVNQAAIPTMKLEVGRDGAYQGKVRKGLTASQFGFTIMTRNADGSYRFRSRAYDDVSETMVNIFEMEVPKGPRVPAAAGDNEPIGAGGIVALAAAGAVVLVVAAALLTRRGGADPTPVTSTSV